MFRSFSTSRLKPWLFVPLAIVLLMMLGTNTALWESPVLAQDDYWTGTWRGPDPDDDSIVTISLTQRGRELQGAFSDTYSGYPDRQLVEPGFIGPGSGNLVSTTEAEMAFQLTRWDGEAYELHVLLSAVDDFTLEVAEGTANGWYIVLNRDERLFECGRYPGFFDIADPPPFDPPELLEDLGEAGEIEAEPPCPEGQIPIPLDLHAPKGSLALEYSNPRFYAGAWKGIFYGTGPSGDGGGVVTRVERPAILKGQSGHSLFEISIQRGKKHHEDTIEIGWHVDEALWSLDPHLFVFYWVDGTGKCYNGCGFKQTSSTLFVSMPLKPGSQTYMGWVYYQGNWWGWYANKWLGYYPGKLWQGKFVKHSWLQWFGEVSEDPPAPPPESDMGNGLPPTEEDKAARFWYPCSVDAAEWICWIDSSPNLNQPNTPWYAIANIGGSVHVYGGPGGKAGVGHDP